MVEGNLHSGWTTVENNADPLSTPVRSVPEKVVQQKTYLPFLETLRLYAGWLLAWYGIVYIVGAYQYLKPLPFRVPYAESLFLSPLVLSFTFASYLFLLCCALYRASGKSKSSAIVVTVIGIGAFVLYRMNLQ
ncbi:hypothetical protein FJZ28_02740 [Candidatus Peregrinibacteria bacterium]|nr:hypothetical protein [Candidatus Peregrinibacteria bacterium]